MTGNGLRVPPHLVQMVRHFVQDFDTVTRAWLAAGIHTPDEVAEWRLVIQADMSGEASVNPEIDPRGRDERIWAWCGTFKRLATEIKRGAV